MMKKIILIEIILFTTLVGCAQKISFPALSKEIYKRHSGPNENKSLSLSAYKRNARNEAFNKRKSSFLYGALDTLFIMESYNIETAVISGTIFSNKGQINYSYDRKGITFLKESSYTNYELKLVAKWDTVSIRKEEKLHAVLFGGNIIYASKCFINNGIWVVEDIYFKDFFDLKRDN